MSTSFPTAALFLAASVLFCLLASGCGGKKQADTAQEERKTFVGAQSINEVPEQYRKMERR